MYSITSKYAPYKGAFRVYPEGRKWENSNTDSPMFRDYSEAYQAVRAHLLLQCDWTPSQGEGGEGWGGLMPEGHDTSWFNFGDTYVNADGEEITIFEA